jgi:hypothetical protein
MRSTHTIPSRVGLDSHYCLTPRGARWRVAAVGAAFWLGCSMALGAAGCTPRQAAPALATGERPVTGVPRFDRVFADINSALVAVQEARAEVAEARGALAHRVGLQSEAPFDLLGARLRERTARLAQDGLTLQLEFAGIDEADGDDDMDGKDAAGGAEATDSNPGDPSASDAGGASPTATLSTPGREPQARELRLLEALAQAALSGATVYTNMGHVRRRTEKLLAEVTELSGQVDTAFTDIDSRERTRIKLDEARSFLPQLGTQAHEVAGLADTLISLLDEAANTVPVGPPKKRPPPAAPAPKPVGAAQPQVLPPGRGGAPATSPPLSSPVPAAPAPTSAPPPGSSPPPSATP